MEAFQYLYQMIFINTISYTICRGLIICIPANFQLKAEHRAQVLAYLRELRMLKVKIFLMLIKPIGMAVSELGNYTLPAQTFQLDSLEVLQSAPARKLFERTIKTQLLSE